MAEKKVHLRIITPEEITLDEKVDMVIMRCTTGDMGILPGHEARSAVLDYGVVRIYSDIADVRWLAVYGGLAEMKNNVLTILANAAEWPQDIDVELVELEREQAERRLKMGEDDLEIQRDQALLRRTLVQLEVSSYPFIAGKSASNDS